jgi:hypothetical protein
MEEGKKCSNNALLRFQYFVGSKIHPFYFLISFYPEYNILGCLALVFAFYIKNFCIYQISFLVLASFLKI